MLDSIDHRALLADDRAAVAALVENLQRLTLWIARNRYRFSREEAEETLVEIVATLWKDDKHALRAWRGEGTLSTYLTSIVHRACLMEIRRRERRAAELPVEELDVFPAEDIAAGPERREREAIVERALSELPERDRELIRLRFTEDRGYDEITGRLDISAGAARKAVHTAVARLRDRVRRLAPELFGGGAR